MGSSPKPAIRVVTAGLVFFALLSFVLQAESANMRPIRGRIGPPSPMGIRMRRDPPPKTMMMAASGMRPSSPRRQFYNHHYRPLQRPRKSPPPHFHYGHPPKYSPHASYSTHKNHYAPYPKQELGARRPPYKFAPGSGGSHGPPKYHRPSDSSHMKPQPSFPSKNKYNTPQGRPVQNPATPSSVSFPTSTSDNAQVIKGTRDKPTYQTYGKPSYNGYISTTEQNSQSDYFAAPVSTSFHAVSPGSNQYQSTQQISNTAANFGLAPKPASEVLNGLPSSLTSFPNSPSIPNAFTASSGSPAVSFSFIEHGNSGSAQQQAVASNYQVAASSPQAFQAPASQSFGFVPYSDNGQAQSASGISQIIQFPASGGGRTTRKTPKTSGESQVLSPNYYDSSSSIAVSASIPTFESHSSFGQSDISSRSNDDRFTQVSYPSNHRSSYEPNK